MRKLVFLAIIFIMTISFIGLSKVDMVGARAKVFPMLIELEKGRPPEGIAVGRGSSFYVSSLLDGGVYRGDLRTGEVADLVPAQGDRLAVGLAVDVRSNAIFVAGGGPFLNPNLTTGSAYVYDAETGAPLAAYEFATGEDTFVNDVVVTRDAAYFTDSFRPVLYKVPLGPGGALPNPETFEVLPLINFVSVSGEVNANGIEATSDGKDLVLVNSFTGVLYRVDPDTGAATQIEGVSVPSGDGLVLAGNTLYVVQNFLNKIGIVTLNSSLTAGVVSDTPLTSDDFRIPTTAAIFGSTIYAVNARFDEWLLLGLPPTDLEFEVVGLPLP